ncbi:MULTISPECIES: hypothetical protein [unclassified Nocardioides]|uniref:hypothetical protein n=1 Tax=unclassified Nocardioides TaxID=2615069 RepID=UPI001153CEE5|nr:MULTISPECIES: hypothetical protein [unclassified Nocardioides]TQK69882.1 hypothetical protein FBY23_1648 [Nocardioides sp. SLBN-35]WGY00882.1 hypothetical protein QI633_20365 [Nocardioides sp. QY071]
MPDKSLVRIVLGIALTMAALPLDGLPRGFCQGAGVALILLGVLTLSARLRKRKGDDGMWLPSRDEDQR